MKKSLFILSLCLFSFYANAQEKQDSIRIDLNKAIEIALSENPTIRIADREIEVKKNYKKEQIVPLFPDVSGTASYNRTLLKQTMAMDFMGQTQEISVGNDNTWTVGVNATLPIIAPAAWFNLQLSQLDVELAMESARSSKISLINEVKKAYYNYMFAKKSHEVLQLNYDNMLLNYENIEQKHAQGLASEFDKLRAEVQVKNQIPNLKAAERGIELSLMMLKVLVGINLDEAVIFEGALEDYEQDMLERPIPGAASLSLEKNSDLIQLEIALQQLNTANKITKSSASPTLGLSGNLQTSSFYDDGNYSKDKWYNSSYVAIGLNVPIVSWAGTSYKIKSNKLNIRNLEEQKQYIEDNLMISVRNSINQITGAIDELESNKESMLMAEKAYNIAQKQYEVGMSTWLDLSASELALTNARLAYNQSIYNYLTAYADLEKTLGNN